MNKDKRRESTPADDLVPPGSTSCMPSPNTPTFSDTTFIFAANPNSTDKEPIPLEPTCGICEDHFQETYSPVSASLTANSSTHLPFGLRLPCPNKHSYCIACLSQYIVSKLDPNGTGRAPEEQIVFPIRCPECPSDEWVNGIQDDIAERILTEDKITLWVSKGSTPILNHRIVS